MKNFIWAIIHFVKNKNIKELVYICWGGFLLIIFLFMALPIKDKGVSIISRGIPAFAFFLMGLGGVAIIIKKEYPFRSFIKGSQLGAILYGIFMTIIGFFGCILFLLPI